VCRFDIYASKPDFIEIKVGTIADKSGKPFEAKGSGVVAMLNAEQRAIVKSTVPLLESGGEALTTHFYKHDALRVPASAPAVQPGPPGQR
jgi:hypothetical protein